MQLLLKQELQSKYVEASDFKIKLYVEIRIIDICDGL